jgi:hypothetical protein
LVLWGLIGSIDSNPSTQVVTKKTFEQKVAETIQREKDGLLNSSFVRGTYHLTFDEAVRALPPADLLPIDVAVKIEVTNSWFVTDNVFSIHLTNNTQSEINSMILYVYDQCSARVNPEYISMILDKEFSPDQEKLFKMYSLGYKIKYLDDTYVWHIEHSRLNSTPWMSKIHDKNMEIFEKIKSMSNEERKNYYTNQANKTFKKYV